MHSNNGRAARMTRASIDVPLREGGAIRPSPNRELTAPRKTLYASRSSNALRLAIDVSVDG